MRAIKFRAFINNEMVPADCLAFEEYAPLQDQLASVEHLMQFTGLKDKNGKEIYEGDVVALRYLDGTVVITQCKWVEYWASFTLSGESGKTYAISFDGSVVDGAYVIGNICENPELLEAGKQ